MENELLSHIRPRRQKQIAKALEEIREIKTLGISIIDSLPNERNRSTIRQPDRNSDPRI